MQSNPNPNIDSDSDSDSKSYNELYARASLEQIRYEMSFVNNRNVRREAADALLPGVKQALQRRAEILRKQEEEEENDRLIAELVDKEINQAEIQEAKKANETKKASSLNLEKRLRETARNLDTEFSSANSKANLLKESPDVFCRIASSFENDFNTYIALNQTCRRLNAFFQPELKKELKKHLEPLLMAVLQDNYAEAQERVAKNPGLLFQRGTVLVDSSGYTVRGTAYQLALGAANTNRAILDERGNLVLDAAGQIQIRYPDEGIAEMLSSYFKKAFHGDEKAANAEIFKQQEEQFPGGYEAYENSDEVKVQKANQLRALRKVIAAIGKANVQFANGATHGNKNSEIKTDAQCENALNEFRELLKPKCVITKGHYFNIELLIEALRLYDNKERHKAFGGRCSSPKNVLMWREVVCHMRHYLPASYLKAFSQSLILLIMTGDRVARVPGKYDDVNEPFLTFMSLNDNVACHRLSIEPWWRDMEGLFYRWKWGQPSLEEHLVFLWRSKTAACRALMPPQHLDPNATMCITM
jgi:hypothetical protein